MSVVNQNETGADLGEVAEAGIHLPEPTDALVTSLKKKTTNMAFN